MGKVDSFVFAYFSLAELDFTDFIQSTQLY